MLHIKYQTFFNISSVENSIPTLLTFWLDLALIVLKNGSLLILYVLIFDLLRDHAATYLHIWGTGNFAHVFFGSGMKL